MIIVASGRMMTRGWIKGYRIRRACYMIVVILSLANGTQAQHPWYEISAGPSVSFSSGVRNPYSYNFRILPQAGLMAFFPFNKKVAFKTGLIYQNKSLDTKKIRVTDPDTASISYDVVSRQRYHFLDIPLQLAVNIGRDMQGFWRIAGGMSYSFLVSSRSDADLDRFEHESFVGDRHITWEPTISMERVSNNPELPSEEGSPLYLFTPALRLDITYQWQERLLLSAYYQYNLQDLRIRTSGASIANLNSAGLSFGILFW
jgi:hypothetical protein